MIECTVARVISAEDIDLAISDIARKLNARFANHSVLVCPLLEGGVVFAGKLLTRLTFDVSLRSIKASRYVGTTTRRVSIGDLPDFCGLHVLFLDEILDAGDTLREVVCAAHATHPLSVSTAVLLLRDTGAGRSFEPDVYGVKLQTPAFVVGEGLDYDGRYRNLAGIWEVEI